MLRAPSPIIPTDVNKVIYGGRTLIDLSQDTVNTTNLLLGVCAHSKSGMKIYGTYVAPKIQEGQTEIIDFTGDQTYTINPSPGYDAMASLSLTVRRAAAPVTYATGSQASVRIAGGETTTITLTTVTFTPVLVELFMKGSGTVGGPNLICARRLPNGTSQYVANKYYRGVSPTIVVSGKNVQVKLYNNDNTRANSGVINWQVAGYE